MWAPLEEAGEYSVVYGSLVVGIVSKHQPQRPWRGQGILMRMNPADCMSVTVTAHCWPLSLGEAELDIAHIFQEASRPYMDNPIALHVRAMNMFFEGLKEQGALMLVPSTSV